MLIQYDKELFDLVAHIQTKIADFMVKHNDYPIYIIVGAAELSIIRRSENFTQEISTDRSMCMQFYMITTHTRIHIKFIIATILTCQHYLDVA